MGLDQNIINNTLIEKCTLAKNRSTSVYLAIFEFDSLNVSQFYLENNVIGIDYLFKNYENENSMNPSYNLSDILLLNN